RPELPTPRYPDLPVVAHRQVLLDAIRDHQVVVVAGETGSGKSTQLPKLCLELGLGRGGLIGHTQPRRLAARAISERIAEELDTEIGQAVGYSVRFNDRVGLGTYIKVMTDGILLAEIQRDRMLRAYDVLIIDEAHERSLNIDFLLGYLRQLLPKRPDLKVIITSATIDTERFSAHFGDAPVVEVSGRSFPVDVRYRPIGDDEDDDRDQTQAICDAVQELMRVGPGDILVFLSGEREIRDTADALARLDLRGTELLPLYARLSASEQHRVFAPHRSRRVVLATNVAETSLTVPGIIGVVDPGTARISRYNRRTKVQRLPIEAISQASAQQRAGRCGRVAPGTCIRLYSEEDFDGRPAFTEPEILRTNLASVILQMAALGLGDMAAFPFVEPPDARSIKDGILLLEELGALDRGGSHDHVRLTEIGRRLARIPADPRLARMVLEADRHGVVAEVLVLAAALSIQDPRERPTGSDQQAALDQHRRFADPESDFLSYLNLWRYLREQQKTRGSSQFRRMCKAEHLHHLRIREWQDVHSQLRQVARGIGLEVRPLADEPDRDGLHRALLSGLLSHIGMLDPDGNEYRGAREARFVIAPGSALGKRRPKWVMAAELVETNRLRARTVAQISPDRIEQTAAHLVTRSHGEPWWEEERGAAMTVERVSLYGLPIVSGRRVQLDRVDRGEARAMFLRHALVDGDWDGQHAFVQANKERVADVVALEERVRRDLLVDDDTLVAFFDARVPAEVTTARRFDTWWKGEQRARPELLTYNLVDLTEPGAASLDLAGFPDVWPLGAARLPLTYVADPASDLDGVVVDVPLTLLDRVGEAGLDWQVPGRRLELVTALIRSLPKELRRHHTPAQDVAQGVLEQIGPEDGRLLDALAQALSQRAGIALAPHHLDLTSVPDTLRVTYRAVDAAARPLAWSRDLPALRRRLAERVREALAAAAPIDEVTGARSWVFGTVPATVTVAHAGQDVTGHPALVDEGDTVALRVLPSEAEQRTAMWGGTRRLLLLQLGSPLRTLDKALPNATKLALAASPRVSAAEAYRECAAAAIDQLLVEQGGPVWDADTFRSLLARVRAGFVAAASACAGLVGEILVGADAVEARLSTMLTAAHDDTVLDVQAHLARLLHRGWISSTAYDRLPDLARYVRALQHRVDKARTEPGRDRRHLPGLQALEQEYRSAARRDLDGRVRAMLEELRVSTFAQSVGAKGGVSEPKVRAAIARLS
ncbi:MAG: ATP-dependent RNA helicase HrpA, partial [Acidimicrobiales bacterium]